MIIGGEVLGGREAARPVDVLGRVVEGDGPRLLEQLHLPGVVVPQEGHKSVQELWVVEHVEHHLLEAAHMDQHAAKAIPPGCLADLAHPEDVAQQLLRLGDSLVRHLHVDLYRPEVQPVKVSLGLDVGHNAVSARGICGPCDLHVEAIVYVRRAANRNADIQRRQDGVVVGDVLVAQEVQAKLLFIRLGRLTLALLGHPLCVQVRPAVLRVEEHHRPLGAKVVAGSPESHLLGLLRQGGDLGDALGQVADDAAITR